MIEHPSPQGPIVVCFQTPGVVLTWNRVEERAPHEKLTLETSRGLKRTGTSEDIDSVVRMCESANIAMRCRDNATFLDGQTLNQYQVLRNLISLFFLDKIHELTNFLNFEKIVFHENTKNN